MKQLRVLIVDDSRTIRAFLSSLIESAPDMIVVGEARDGHEAIVMAKRLKPDIISMDVQMPHLDGLAATNHLMQENPLPIVIVSGRLTRRDNKAVDLAFMALEAGALAVLETPPNYNHPDFARSRDNFLNTLRAMAGVSVVRRWGVTKPIHLTDTELQQTPQLQVIVMGASAGGPIALYKILGKLPGDFPVPIAIVQHMAEGFTEGLIRWLNSGTPLHVTRAEHGQIVKPGEVIVAGSGAHLKLQKSGRYVKAVLEKQTVNSPYLPSVDALFSSTAEHYGAQALGILLTGMGDDGARGLLQMREHGAHTIVQDRESCLVYGMPGAAVQLDAAEQILPLKQIAPTILDLVKTIKTG